MLILKMLQRNRNDKGGPQPRLQLRPFERRDCASLLGQFPTPDDLRLWSGNYFSFPLDDAQLKNHWKANRRGRGGILLLAERAVSERMVGFGEITRITVNHSAFFSRILILSDSRGQGLGAELVRGLLQHAFQRLRLHRIELNVCQHNRAAIRCYESVGFVREGLLRDALAIGEGRYWSEYRMSLLRPDYRAR